MKTLFRTSLLAASLALVFGLSAEAQVITTTTGFDAAASYAAADPFDSADDALTQTFTGVTAIDSVTFRFIVDITGLTYPGSALNYTFQSWNTGTDVADTLITSGTITLVSSAILGPGDWQHTGFNRYLDQEISLSQTGLTAATTYGLTIFGDAATAGANSLRIGAGSTSYANGGSFLHTGESFGEIQSGGGALASDLAFSANVTLAAVPEASTAAVLFAGLFVGGLMFRRRRHLGSVQAQA